MFGKKALRQWHGINFCGYKFSLLITSAILFRTVLSTVSSMKAFDNMYLHRFTSLYKTRKHVTFPIQITHYSKQRQLWLTLSGQSLENGNHMQTVRFKRFYLDFCVTANSTQLLSEKHEINLINFLSLFSKIAQ